MKILQKKVDEAVKSGKFFVTITYLDGKGMLKNFYTTKNFFDADLQPTLDLYKNQIEQYLIKKTNNDEVITPA